MRITLWSLLGLVACPDGLPTASGPAPTLPPGPPDIWEATTPPAPPAPLPDSADTADSSDTGLPLPAPPSCANLASPCPGGDCCASLLVPATTYAFGRTPGAGEDCVCTTCDASACGTCGPLSCDLDERPAEATISAFRLDRFEVTVGRFRRWVDAGAPLPQTGDGLHTHLPGGQLPGELGWSEDWTVSDNWKFDLFCSTNLSHWTDTPGPYESQPINCVTWYEAYAFCVWDGGFLPSETEWELAASGGEDRVFAWSTPPEDDTITDVQAVVGDFAQRGPTVGARPAGQGRWGHDDLTGGVEEWVADRAPWTHPDPCTDCFGALGSLENRGLRGGAWVRSPDGMRAASRRSNGASGRSPTFGFRCARAP